MRTYKEVVYAKRCATNQNSNLNDSDRNSANSID